MDSANGAESVNGTEPLHQINLQTNANNNSKTIMILSSACLPAFCLPIESLSLYIYIYIYIDIYIYTYVYFVNGTEH